MKGSIKYAKIQITYNQGRKKERIVSRPVKTVMTIYPGKKKIYNREIVIRRITDELKLKKAENIKIHKVKILQDLGKTNYDIS